MSPDLTEIINTAEKAVGVTPEAKPAAEGASERANGEAEGEEDDEDEAEEGAAAGTGKLSLTKVRACFAFHLLTPVHVPL